MVEYHPQLWNPHRDKKIVHADFLAAEIDEFYHPEVELIGDLAHTMWMLDERIPDPGLFGFDFENQRRCHIEMSKGTSDQLASAFGWNGRYVSNSKEFAGVLENAFEESGPSLVVIPIDYRENALLTKNSAK